MSFRTGRRCKFYDEVGNAGPTGGCRRVGAGCTFVHPGEPGWATATPAPPHPHFSNSFRSIASSSGFTGSNRDPGGATSKWDHGVPKGPRRDSGAGSESGGRNLGPSSRETDEHRDTESDDWAATMNSVFSSAGPRKAKSLAAPPKPSPADGSGWGAPPAVGWDTPAAAGWGSPVAVGWGSPGAPAPLSWKASAAEQAESPWNAPDDPSNPNANPYTSKLFASNSTPPTWGDPPGQSKPEKQVTTSATKKVPEINTTVPSNTRHSKPQASTSNGRSNAWGASSVTPSPRSPIQRMSSVKEPRSPVVPSHPRLRIEDKAPVANRKTYIDRPKESSNPWGMEATIAQSRQHETSVVAGMLLPSLNVSDDMDVDYSPSEVVPEPQADWTSFMSEIAKAIDLQHSLDDTNELRAGLAKLRLSVRYKELAPGSTAHTKVSKLFDNQQKLVRAQRTHLNSMFESLQQLAVPVVHSSTDALAQYEHRVEELVIYIEKVQDWVAQVGRVVETQEERTAAEQELKEKVDKLEEKVANLEDYTEELRHGCLNGLVEYLGEKVTDIARELDEADDDSEAQDSRLELQSTRDRLKDLSEQLGRARATFSQQEKRTLPSHEENEALKRQVQQLEKDKETTQEAYQANERELQELRGKLEELQSAPPAPTPVSVVTEDDLLAVLLPLVRQQTREDCKAACNALLEGVNTVLVSYQDQLSTEVWSRLQPVLKLSDHIQTRMSSSSGRAPGPASTT